MQRYDLQITDQLKKRGYKCLNDNNNIYGRFANDVIYVVALGNSYNINADAVRNFDNKITAELTKSRQVEVRILNLIFAKTGADGSFTDDVIDVVRHVRNVWIYSEDYAKLFIFENQPEDFDGLRGCLETDVKPQKKSYKSFVSENTEPVTLAVIIINIIVYIITALNSDIELALADNYFYVVVMGQYYRIFTSMFVHFGIVHLFNNMLVLLIMGPRAERLMGKLPFLTAYIITGITAAVCSLYFGEYYTFSAGASGAICGIFGMLIVYAIANKGSASGLSLRYLIFVSAITILNGFTTTGIDNYAHIGGFVSGIIVGIVSIPIHNMVVKNKPM